MRTPSKSEAASKDSFEGFLREHLPNVPQTWCVAEHPHDFLLTVGTDTFIVEVTEVRLLMKFGGLRLPHTIVRDHFDAFVREVEAAAIDAGILSGTYVACFPRPIERFSSLRNDLKLHLLGLLAQMSLQPSGTQDVFLRLDRRRFTLEKIDTAGASLLMSGPFDSRWEGEARRELCELVGERIDVKAARVQNHSLPTILLLDERNPFADGSMYIHCQPDALAVAAFHSIYVSRPGAIGILLRSGFPNLSGVWDVAKAPDTDAETR